MVKCPVCEENLPDPVLPSCYQCGWDFQHDITLVSALHEIPEKVRMEYIQRVSIAKRNWNERIEAIKRQTVPPEQEAEQKPIVTVEELKWGELLQRDPFETLEEFRQRLESRKQYLESRNPYPAGEARLLREEYDIETGRFPLQVTLAGWMERFSLPDKKYHITAERDLAREIYQAGEVHPLQARLVVRGKKLRLLEVNLHTPAALLPVENFIVAHSSSLLSGHEDSVESVAFSP
ncbi:MAG: hypothetical protein SCK29_12870, partial [Bacillota bacterium]|nr:hypothetical protein [Bacillota bacterium]